MSFRDEHKLDWEKCKATGQYFSLRKVYMYKCVLFINTFCAT